MKREHVATGRWGGWHTRGTIPRPRSEQWSKPASCNAGDPAGYEQAQNLVPTRVADGPAVHRASSPDRTARRGSRAGRRTRSSTPGVPSATGVETLLAPDPAAMQCCSSRTARPRRRSHGSPSRSTSSPPTAHHALTRSIRPSRTSGAELCSLTPKIRQDAPPLARPSECHEGGLPRRTSLSTSGETLTIEESMTLRARTENAGHGDECEWSWSGG